MRVHVAAHDTGELEAPGQALKAPVASPVIGQIGTLELDPQPLGPERLAQARQRRLVVDAVGVAAAQADQPLGVVEDLRKAD
jgi:hypothetical protein